MTIPSPRNTTKKDEKGIAHGRPKSDATQKLYDYLLADECMGLFAIPLRQDAIGRVVSALLESGYVVVPRQEDEVARYFICEGGRRPLPFWITKRCHPRFCIGVGKAGREVVQILSKRGLFEDETMPQ